MCGAVFGPARSIKKGKQMKKFLLICAALSLLIFQPAPVQANYVQTGLDPVRFWVVDDLSSGGDHSVTLSITDFNLSGGTLEYSLDQSAWSPVNLTNGMGDITIGTGEDDRELVYFRLDFGSGDYVTAADLTFSGSDQEAANLWNAVWMNWELDSGIHITWTVSCDDDNVAPVPIPGAAWLLGTGLLGLVGLRRKTRI